MSKPPHKGFVPSPLFASWWGPLADQVWQPPPFKGGPHARTRRKHKREDHRSPYQKCPCEAFTLCDLRYQHFSAAEKKIWKDAVKKPYTSAYELFMKECLCGLIKTAYYPTCPSASGGFNCKSVITGPDRPPEGFVGQVPPDTHYRCTGPPFYECEEDPEGEYDTLIACTLHCNPPKYECSGAPEYLCEEHEHGSYDSFGACLAVCQPDPPPPTGPDCFECDPGTTPLTLRFHLQGLIGYAAKWNGDYDLKAGWFTHCVFSKNTAAYSCTVRFEDLWINATFIDRDGPSQLNLLTLIPSPRNCWWHYLLERNSGGGIFADEYGANAHIYGV